MPTHERGGYDYMTIFSWKNKRMFGKEAKVHNTALRRTRCYWNISQISGDIHGSHRHLRHTQMEQLWQNKTEVLLKATMTTTEDLFSELVTKSQAQWNVHVLMRWTKTGMVS